MGHCHMSGSVTSWPAYKVLRRQVKWSGTPISLRIFHSLLWYTQWRKSTLNIHWNDWSCSWNSNTLATWYEELTHWKRPWCWKEREQKGKAATEYEMVGWHHWLNGHHEFEETPGDSEGQGSLSCCSSWFQSQTQFSDWKTSMPERYLHVILNEK